MPDLIRHPGLQRLGFRFSPETLDSGFRRNDDSDSRLFTHGLSEFLLEVPGGFELPLPSDEYGGVN
jgi:hypothetical protein